MRSGEESDRHAETERVIPRGSRDAEETARSRFDVPARTENMLVGDVEAYRGLHVDVVSGGERWTCVVRGRLETAVSEDRVLLAVGDHVEFTPDGETSGVIERLQPRRSVLVRGDRRVQHFRHVIAANIDGVALVTSVDNPRFRPGIVDRFLVAASSQGLSASIVINKADLLGVVATKVRDEIDEFVGVYRGLGHDVVLASAIDRSGLDPLINHLRRGRMALVGHSGVGKSSLLNALSPELDLKAHPVNRKTGKGTHTTTVAQLFRLPQGVEVIDTPGIRELDVVDVAAVDLEAHFPEMKPLVGQCEMNDCAHRGEPGCAVAAAIERGEMHPRRYESYLTLRAELEEAEVNYD